MAEDRIDVSDYLARFSRLIDRGKTVLDVGCGDGLPADRYLVGHGLAVNGIDVSTRLIDLARKNVPEGFYEVKDMVKLQEGEYCVDGVVSLRAMLHLPRDKYHGLLKNFASFMPRGGALLLAMQSDEPGSAEHGAGGSAGSRRSDGAAGNAELLEDAGFAVLLGETVRQGDERYQIILARS